MAIVYLMGSDVESDANRQKARLYGIAHELYVQDVEDSGGTYSGEYVTMFHRNIIKKDGVNEFALEIDDTSAQYTKMIALHMSKVKTVSEMNSAGWNIT